jgi:hypothetical protein
VHAVAEMSGAVAARYLIMADQVRRPGKWPQLDPDRSRTRRDHAGRVRAVWRAHRWLNCAKGASSSLFARRRSRGRLAARCPAPRALAGRPPPGEPGRRSPLARTGTSARLDILQKRASNRPGQPRGAAGRVAALEHVRTVPTFARVAARSGTARSRVRSVGGEQPPVVAAGGAADPCPSRPSGDRLPVGQPGQICPGHVGTGGRGAAVGPFSGLCRSAQKYAGRDARRPGGNQGAERPGRHTKGAVG